MNRVYSLKLNSLKRVDWNAYPEDIVSRERNMIVSVVVLFFLIMVFFYPIGFFHDKVLTRQQRTHKR